MSNTERTAWLATCEAAARAGGRELNDWRGRFTTREKGITDLVTDADLASQAAIQRVIAERYPEHGFIGEEVTEVAYPQGDQLTWVVDPLDGTTNYVHGYPHYAVSVALTRGRDLQVGVVYDPVTDLCFSAAAGEGARCNGEPLRTASVEKLSDALVAVSLPAHVSQISPDLADFVTSAQRCQAVRRSGSAALNLAFVAQGWLDAFWAHQIHPWDVAAGVLLIREAGGLVTGLDGGEFDLWNPHFLSAATPRLHTALRDVLTPVSG